MLLASIGPYTGHWQLFSCALIAVVHSCRQSFARSYKWNASASGWVDEAHLSKGLGVRVQLVLSWVSCATSLRRIFLHHHDLLAYTVTNTTCLGDDCGIAQRVAKMELLPNPCGAIWDSIRYRRHTLGHTGTNHIIPYTDRGRNMIEHRLDIPREQRDAEGHQSFANRRKKCEPPTGHGQA